MIGGQGGPDSRPGEPIPGTLEHVLSAIRAYTAAEIPNGPSAVAHELRHLRQGIDNLEFRFSQGAGRFADSSYWDDQGFVSPYQWIRLTC